MTEETQKKFEMLIREEGWIKYKEKYILTEKDKDFVSVYHKDVHGGMVIKVSPPEGKLISIKGIDQVETVSEAYTVMLQFSDKNNEMNSGNDIVRISKNDGVPLRRIFYEDVKYGLPPSNRVRFDNGICIDNKQSLDVYINNDVYGENTKLWLEVDMWTKVD